MRSDRYLRACMQALVLLNLAFVQMTGIAGLHWLLPLYALALAAPLLHRMREHVAYRWLWNGAVVCFFLVLLRHALRADLAYVLEDGLVLAVLCQVHLLNNLRSSQRPDLLFFNAFLIAIITGFMNRGLGFPLAFLIFVPCFVIGLQLLTAARTGRVLEAHATRQLLVDGSLRAGLLLGLSLAAFLFWPRDFERKALLHGRIELSTGGAGKLEIGFTEKLRLGRTQAVRSSGRPALRVLLLAGQSADVPTLWRGATLAATTGNAWHEGTAAGSTRVPFDERWHGRRGRLARQDPGQAEAARVEVVRFEQETERLFAPLGACSLQLAPEQAGLLLRPRPDGTVDVAETGEVRYELVLARHPIAPPAGSWTELPPALAPYVDLPATRRVQSARELASRLAEQGRAGGEQHEIVARLRDHLTRTYTYLPPGSEGAARTLEEFLRGEAGGHCEFFASAMATMLRSLAIPCRVATGFRSTRWDADGRVLAFGTRDAHAWVEVCDPRAGWYAVDPSPILAGGPSGAGLLARLRARAISAWGAVTGFDAERRKAFLSALGALPALFAGAWRERPLAVTACSLAPAFFLVWTLLRRRRRTPPAVRLYATALRRARLRLLPGETPRELLARAGAGGLPPQDALALEEATRRHEAERYAV